MNEDDIFKEADIHFGTKYNRGHVKAFADAIFSAGVMKGSQMATAVYKDIAGCLAASADKQCRGCDGTGLFYGNVAICPCILNCHDVDELGRRMVKASQLHALFVGADQGHREHMDACRKALDLYRIEFNSPGVRYWWHAESDSLVTTCNDIEVDRLFDGPEDLLEISQEQARERLKADLEKRVSGNSDKPSALPIDDEEL
ncbi:hypothetical protein AXY1_28 [Achromobacter phage AXY1]|nr:hypothetical protein AXY1_28 [Achromobacter phage AXY1]